MILFNIKKAKENDKKKNEAFNYMSFSSSQTSGGGGGYFKIQNNMKR